MDKQKKPNAKDKKIGEVCHKRLDCESTCCFVSKGADGKPDAYDPITNIPVRKCQN